MKAVTILLCTYLLAACSILPYENDYSCRLEDNYGKCMSITESYNGGKGEQRELRLIPGKKIKLNKRHTKIRERDIAQQPTSKQLYVEDLYKEMSQLIREPVTPIIKPAKEIRTLILTYSANQNKKTLFMPRYVYSIVEDAEFVIEQYFKTPERDAHIISPMEDM